MNSTGGCDDKIWLRMLDDILKLVFTIFAVQRDAANPKRIKSDLVEKMFWAILQIKPDTVPGSITRARISDNQSINFSFCFQVGNRITFWVVRPIFIPRSHQKQIRAIDFHGISENLANCRMMIYLNHKNARIWLFPVLAF